MGAEIPATSGDAARNLKRVHADKGFRKRILGPDFGVGLQIPDASKDLLQDLVALRTAAPSVEARVPTKEVEETLVQRLETDAVAANQD